MQPMQRKRERMTCRDAQVGDAWRRRLYPGGEAREGPMLEQEVRAGGCAGEELRDARRLSSSGISSEIRDSQEHPGDAVSRHHQRDHSGYYRPEIAYERILWHARVTSIPYLYGTHV